jgi:hypothetical protein
MKHSNLIRRLGKRVAVLAILGVAGCVAGPDRVMDYLSGIEVASPQPPLSAAVHAGLVLVLPESELAKPTAPPRDVQDKLADRLQRALTTAQQIEITRVLSPVNIPGDGRHALSLDRLREAAKPAHLDTLAVVVLTSQSVQRVQPYPLIETQLFAKMDLALVDLATGRLLLSEHGEEDYILGQRRDVDRTISYPRVYYRDMTTSGPFTIVEGDPYRALGEIAFRAAADQLILRLQERLNLSFNVIRGSVGGLN